MRFLKECSVKFIKKSVELRTRDSLIKIIITFANTLKV